MERIREHLIERVKQCVLQVEPDAEVILHGSRARGDFSAESDWDFLILVGGPVDEERTDRVRHRLYEIEWDSGEVISSVIRSREEWGSSLFRATPFHESVEREGIAI